MIRFFSPEMPIFFPEFSQEARLQEQNDLKKLGFRERKNPPEIYVPDGPLAEWVGFEPTCRSYRQTDFESAPL